MRGVKSEDLVAMTDFLYIGEANVYQEHLESFLAIAEELQLKGLHGNQTEAVPKENTLAPKNQAKDMLSQKTVKLEESESFKPQPKSIKTRKGLFINDVIIFGGYRDPPPPPRHHSSLFGYPPSLRA